MSAVLIVGCGYVGERVALAEQAAGARVVALVRSAGSAAHLAARGIASLCADLDDPASMRALPTAQSSLYYFVPPPRSGGTDTRLARFLAAVSAPPLHVVLISTTGVYGDCQGEWVTEDRTPQPMADRARRRLDAEQRLRAWGRKWAVPVAILRVPGIYGPGRLPLERLQAGEPVLREAESPWSNRVHVDDLVRACLAASAQRAEGIYNISDGHPTTMTDYFNHVADAVGLPRPPQITGARARVVLSDGMRSYLAESKRLDNRRMREELGIEPRYPDLAQGLAACVTVPDRRHAEPRPRSKQDSER
jgi:nucleoside-diphosphate-sugar epimerase